MSTTEQTVEDFTRSLNGYEELAIKKEFRSPLGDLRADAVLAMRALVFINNRREEAMKDSEAYAAAMTLTMGEVLDYFADDPEPDGEDPGEA